MSLSIFQMKIFKTNFAGNQFCFVIWSFQWKLKTVSENVQICGQTIPTYSSVYLRNYSWGKMMLGDVATLPADLHQWQYISTITITKQISFFSSLLLSSFALLELLFFFLLVSRAERAASFKETTSHRKRGISQFLDLEIILQARTGISKKKKKTWISPPSLEEFSIFTTKTSSWYIY